MTIIVIISSVSLLLDGILTNFLPYLVNDLTFFTPMFTIVLTLVSYPLFYKDNKAYLTYLFVLGLIYDLFYTNLLFFDALIFLILGYISIYIYKNFAITKIRIILYIVLIIVVYECSFALSIKLLNLVPITIDRLIYKISHSLILNIIYGFFLYLTIIRIVNKYKKGKLCNLRLSIR